MVAPLVLSFDLDDTLWPVEPVMLAAERAMLTWLREEHPVLMQGHSGESMRALRMRVAEQFPRRSHDMTFLRHQALSDLFTQAGHPATYADQAFEVFFAARNRVTLYPDVEASLKRLASRHRLYALSNGNADLERCGIAHLFDGHITAIAAGAAKPDAKIFARLLKESGVSAGEVWHIGDDPHADVVGARQSGMHAIWINRDSKQWPQQFDPPARTISTLSEII
jgi:FMN hydrolase / 5-amino-6-(5-phospho-D-ribitylamino)uracil phosphatase